MLPPALDPPPVTQQYPPAPSLTDHPLLDPSVEIDTDLQHCSSQQSGTWSCSGCNGSASVYEGTPESGELILSGNQARVSRLFSTETNNFARWRHWQAEVVEIERRNGAVSNQLLYQLSQIFQIDCIYGAHPLLAPAEAPSV